MDNVAENVAEIRLYGVSTGNGNNGVSQMYANYYVCTNEPWTLARAAAYSCYKPDAWEFLDNELQVDGDEDYTISATLYEEPGFKAPTVDCPDCYDGQIVVMCSSCNGTGEDDSRPGEDCLECEGTGEEHEDCPTCDGSGVVTEEDYDSGPAAFILEVFSESDEAWVKTRRVPVYASIENAIEAEAIERARAQEV